MFLRFRFLVMLILLSSGILNAQLPEKSHIYLSVCLGISSTSINNEYSFHPVKISGPGLQMDLKAGFGLSHNLFLNVTYNVNKLSNPTIKVPNAYSPRPSEEIALRDRMAGAGFTWYPIPQLFLSAAAGPGTLKIIDRVDINKSDLSDRGLSVQFSAGREWPISKRFGMGLCLTYGFTKIKNTDAGDLKINRFGLSYSIAMH